MEICVSAPLPIPPRCRMHCLSPIHCWVYRETRPDSDLANVSQEVRVISSTYLPMVTSYVGRTESVGNGMGRVVELSYDNDSLLS